MASDRMLPEIMAEVDALLANLVVTSARMSVILKEAQENQLSDGSVKEVQEDGG